MTSDQLKIFKKIPPLETERLILCKISMSHLEDMYEYSKNPLVSKYLLWAPHQTIADTRYQIKTIKKFYRAMKFYDWALIYKPTGKMIGTCGFTEIDVENNKAEIGYVLNPTFWGMGIAKEAINKILSFGFEILKLHKIEAKFMIENTQSKRVLMKCGMNFECIEKDAILVKGKYRTIGIHSMTEYDYFKKSHII